MVVLFVVGIFVLLILFAVFADVFVDVFDDEDDVDDVERNVLGEGTGDICVDKGKTCLEVHRKYSHLVFCVQQKKYNPLVLPGLRTL